MSTSEKMNPVGELTPEGYGEYIMSETITEQPRKSRERRPGRVKQVAKSATYMAAAGVLFAGAVQIKDWVDSFTPNAKHKTALTIGAPETKVYKNVHLDLATIQSAFPVSLRTSLDRFGPSNCDTETLHTGKKGEDPKIETTTDAGLVLDSISVTNENGIITAIAGGEIHLSKSFVDYDENTINVEGASGGLDACIGTNEITQARHIIDVAVQHAGGIAAGCALESTVGRDAFTKGLADFVITTNLARGVDPSAITVEIPDYQESAQSIYGHQVAKFYDAVNGVVNSYLNQTEDHDEPRLNFSQLIDCDQHDIINAS